MQFHREFSSRNISTKSSLSFKFSDKDFLQNFKKKLWKNRKKNFNVILGNSIAFNVRRLWNSGDESTLSHHKYRKNFKLNNRAIPKNSWTSPLFKTVVADCVFSFKNKKSAWSLSTKFAFSYKLLRKTDCFSIQRIVLLKFQQ